MDISVNQVVHHDRALHVPKWFPVMDTYDCHPLPHVNGPTVSEYYEVIRLPKGLQLPLPF